MSTQQGLLQELEEFKEKYPGVRVVPMMTLFHFCTKEAARSFQEAYDHIYGKPGCPWCQKLMKREKIMNG